MFFKKKNPFETITQYLDTQNYLYIRHQKVNKVWNPSFEGPETLFNFMFYVKKYYLIDATDLKGNPIVIEAIWYISYSLFHKNKVFFRNIK